MNPTEVKIVPFEPEPMTALAARFAAAIARAHPISLADVLEGRSFFPGTDRRHVFDTEDGWRLQIALEEFPGRLGRCIHASGCWWAGRGERRIDEEARVLDHYRRISGSTATPLLKFRSVLGSHLLFQIGDQHA